MQSKATTPDEYIAEWPADRKEAIIKLRKEILENLNALRKLWLRNDGILVPHSLYPNGYHCKPTDPLPFVGFASQKNYIAFYHMGIYADPKLLKWFTIEYRKYTDAKLDMGKSCIRFKKPENIPFKLFGELMSKMSVKDWIATYGSALKKSPVKKK